MVKDCHHCAAFVLKGGDHFSGVHQINFTFAQMVFGSAVGHSTTNLWIIWTFSHSLGVQINKVLL